MQLNQFHESDPKESQTNQFAFDKQQIQNYKEEFSQESYQKKFDQFATMKQKNTELIKKVKDLDHKLNNEISLLSKKIVASNKKRIAVPKFESIHQGEIKYKYEALEKLKKTLNFKKNGKNSLFFLMNVIESLKSKLSILNNQILKKKKHLAKIHKVRQQGINQQKRINQEVEKMGDLKIYEQEISNLKKLIQQKSEKIKASKEQFTKIHQRKVSSSRTIHAQSLGFSIKQDPSQETDPQVLALKQQYITKGKKVQSLKAKKLKLTRQRKNIDSELQDKRYILKSLKTKHEEILKIINH